MYFYKNYHTPSSFGVQGRAGCISSAVSPHYLAASAPPFGLKRRLPSWSSWRTGFLEPAARLSSVHVYVDIYTHVCMMYVCMYVCMYACMHSCMYVCMYVCLQMYIFRDTYICNIKRDRFPPSSGKPAGLQCQQRFNRPCSWVTS